MEENNNLPVENENVTEVNVDMVVDSQTNEEVVEETPVVLQEEVVQPTEQAVVEPVSEVQPVLEQPVNIGFSSADTQVVNDPVVSIDTQQVVQSDVQQPIDGTPIANVGTPLKPKKKINKTLIILLIFVIIFGGVMLMMNQGTNPNNNGNDGEITEEEIKVNTGSKWGDLYLTYMEKNKKDLDTYEIAFIDVDYSGTPEMFLKYKDKTDLETLKILYIEDDSVYETKYYHDYRIRYIHSLKDHTTDWYLFLTSTKHYGTYTMISKMIDNMAFDSDIKATNDNELIQYGKRYYDTDYEIVFYNIRRDSHEDDFRDFVAKYDGYNKKVIETKEKIENKYKDYEVKEETVVVQDSVNLAGRSYKFGIYYAEIPLNEEDNIPAHTGAIVLNKNGTMIVDGTLYTYTVKDVEGSLELGHGVSVTLKGSNVFLYKGFQYTYKSE